MPFNSIEELTKSEDAFASKVKAEAKTQLSDNKIAAFWYFDGIKMDWGNEDIFVFGKVSPAGLKSLKSESKAAAIGECMMEDKTLKVLLSRGRIQPLRLKKLMKAVGSAYDAQLVDSFGVHAAPRGVSNTEDDPQESPVSYLYRLADKKLGLAKDSLTAPQIKELNAFITALATLAGGRAPDPKKAQSLFDEFDKKRAEFLKASLSEQKAPDARDNAALEMKWEAVAARFEKVKALITDDERKELRKLWGKAEEAKDGGKAELAGKVLSLLDKTMLGYAKAAMDDQKKVADKADGELKTVGPIGKEDMAKLAKRISDHKDFVAKTEAEIQKEQAALAVLRQTIDAERGGQGTGSEKSKAGRKAANKIKLMESEFRKAEARIGKLRATISTRLTQLARDRDGYEKKSSVIDRRVSELFDAVSGQMSKLGSVLEAMPVEDARKAIEGTIREMAEATAWQQERLKAEAAGGAGHASGRHGAQTGLERQARRAATSEMTPDAKGKLRATGGVTPDQKGNAAGTARTTVKWNGVDITYEEKDGQRVVADRKATVRKLTAVGSTDSKTGSVTGSLWGSPVLEKRAFDAASAAAAKLKDLQYYKNKNGWGEFTSLVVRLGPAKSGGAGWGYAVRKTDVGGAAIPDDVAASILDRFEAGEITLDKLFDEMKVAMVGKDGKNMVQGVTAVFRRNDVTSAFGMVTMYPNDEVSADGWEPYNDAKDGLEFKGADGVAKARRLSVLP